jgi:hypothetical protein
VRRSSRLLLSCCGLAAAAPSLAGDEAIPFREAWGWAVVLPVTVAGSRVHEFLLDTGTSSTLLDPALAGELGIVATSRVNLVTPAGEREVGLGHADLRIGGRVLAGVEVLIAELPGLGSDEPGVRGMLGQSALSRLEYTIDHARRRLVVHGGSDGVTSAGGWTRPTLDARVGCGRSSARLVVDSGVAMPVLFEQGRRALAVELGNGVRAATNAGEAVWRQGRVASLCVAGGRSGPLDVVVRPRASRAREEDGLLPSRFFARVRVGLAGAVVGVDHW